MNAEKKNFYGWILLVAIGIMFLCSSGFILVGASVVNPLMMADSSMNMNATLMGLGFTLFVLCQGIPAPLIGQFITKYGQKKTFIVGGLLLIIGGLLMAFVVKTTIGYLIAFGVILSIGSQMAGQVTMQTSVSAWFVQKRALAMSIATVIGAIGSFISPRILNSIVASTGRWQDAWLLVAGLGVVVIIIAVALVVDKPSDKGQYPDGIEPGSAVAAAQKFSRVYKTSEVYDHKAVLKNRNFWFIALAATGAFCLYSLNSAAAVKHFTTQGFESAAIVAAVSYMGIANMVGKLSVGPIGDKVEPTRMMAVYLLIIAVGTLCSAFAKSQAMMVAYYALFKRNADKAAAFVKPLQVRIGYAYALIFTHELTDGSCIGCDELNVAELIGAEQMVKHFKKIVILIDRERHGAELIKAYAFFARHRVVLIKISHQR